jgi:hypothetical protein
VDLWWSGKHHQHGGNIQVISTPDGWPLCTSEVRPGREHDTAALRFHAEILPLLTAWTGDDLPALGDLGYEGESDIVTVQLKKPAGRADRRAEGTQQIHIGKRAIGESANALLKMTFKTLRNLRLSPSMIGWIVAAALVLVHFEHDRTT